MRHLFQIFFTLMVPLSALFIAASTAYFRLEYTLTKAMKLGVLSGVILGASVSFVAAIVILISRAGNQNAQQPVKQKKKIVPEDEVIVQSSSPSGMIASKFILLMDRTLAFEISRAALHSQKDGQISQGNSLDGELSIRTVKELVKIKISSLTKHTSIICIEAKHNSKYTPEITKFLKNKEHTYLDY